MTMLLFSWPMRYRLRDTCFFLIGREGSCPMREELFKSKTGVGMVWLNLLILERIKGVLTIFHNRYISQHVITNLNHNATSQGSTTTSTSYWWASWPRSGWSRQRASTRRRGPRWIRWGSSYRWNQLGSTKHIFWISPQLLLQSA